tara:strand:+ start:508 stop:657 length:150 start_codon:yes stop_codon:yes gene_type:complete
MELTESQRNMLEKHKIHHTAKHIALMKRLMKNGLSFSKAHKKAMVDVGK